MATQIQLRRGNTTATGAFTGAVAEVTIDTDKKTLVVHDGTTAGGIPLAKESSLSANAAIAQGAYDKANSANVLAQASFNFANTANIKVDSAFAFANIANIKVDAAFSKANAANVLAQAAFDKANTGLANTGTSVTANGLTVYTFANTTVSTSNTTGAVVISGGLGVKGSIYADAIYDSGIEVIAFANQAFNLANTANIKIDSGYAFANTVNVKVDSAYAFANVANTIAQAAFNLANTSNTTADAAFAKANAANVLAQSAFVRANNSLNVQSGGSVTGDVTVTGNLTIVGQTVYANTSTVVIADNILTLNAAINQASAPTVNAGIEIDRGSSTNVSILWNETSDTWTFTNDGSNYLEIANAARLNSAFALANTANIKVDSAFAFANIANIKVDAAFAFSNTVNIKVDSAFAFANIANIKVDAAFTKANAANVLAQAAFNKANTAANLSFHIVAANGTNLVADANTDTLTILGANGVGVTGNATTDILTINLTPTGVTSGTYGNSSTTVTLTVDAQGRITSISQTALTYTETDPNALAFAIALG
jgi:hypothetical protein